MTSGRRDRGRPRLCRPDDVLTAAETVLQTSGAAALSIRRVAEELGTAPMTLYGYFPSKQALLEALAARLLGRHQLEPDPALPLEERARTWMHAYRNALNDSKLFDLFHEGLPITPMLAFAATWTAQLRGEGLDRAAAVHGAQLLLWTVNGFCAAEANAKRADPVALEESVSALPPSLRSPARDFLDHADRHNPGPLFARVVDGAISSLVDRT